MGTYPPTRGTSYDDRQTAIATTPALRAWIDLQREDQHQGPQRGRVNLTRSSLKRRRDRVERWLQEWFLRRSRALLAADRVQRIQNYATGLREASPVRDALAQR